jgi:protein required for attachment to host cells
MTPMKPMRTWILIANDKRARILEAFGNGRNLHLASDPGSRSTNPAGRVSADLDLQRNTATSTALQMLFASQLAAMLVSYLQKNAFDKLIVVAPPVMLDAFRKMIDLRVRERITIEIEKDLTAISNDEISAHFDHIIAI